MTYFWQNSYLPNASGPSASKLREWLKLSPEDAKLLKAAIRDAHDHDSVDTALKLANVLMHGYGVESIEGGYQVDRYYYNIVALYVNTGDSYNNTLLYETERERFLLTTMGDWVERNERRYHIE